MTAAGLLKSGLLARPSTLRWLLPLLFPAPFFHGDSIAGTPRWKIGPTAESFAEIKRPSRGFYHSGPGTFVQTMDGLFLLKETSEESIQFLDGFTINDIEPFLDGLLVATDSGIFKLNLNALDKVSQRLEGYRRSTRDIYPISGNECFLATQDGFGYLNDFHIRLIDKNVQVERILGLDETFTAICLTDPEKADEPYRIGFGTGEHVDYVDCPGPVSAAVFFSGRVVVGTDRGLFTLRQGGAFESVAAGQIHDLLIHGIHLLVASEKGLLNATDEGGKLVFDEVTDTVFFDLAATDSIILALGESVQMVFDQEIMPLSTSEFGEIQRSFSARTLNSNAYFSTNAGVMEITGISSAQCHASLIPSPETVFDITNHRGKLLIATESDLKFLIPAAGGSALLFPILLLAGALSIAGIWILLRSRAPKIFFSYRRRDSATFVGRISDHLARRFGKSRVCFDKTSFELAQDFRIEMERLITECDIVVAVIGEEWVSMEEGGIRRLKAESDYVRIELEIAFSLGKPILPILLRETPMPDKDDLPESIRELVYQNAIRIRNDPDFANDIALLEKTLRRIKRGRPARDPEPVQDDIGSSKN